MGGRQQWPVPDSLDWSLAEFSTANAQPIRRALSADAEAVARIHIGPKTVWGTLQLPYPNPEQWRKRIESENAHPLLACMGDDVVGELTLITFPSSPRRKHVGALGMAVRDDWQGKGVGTALMQAAVEMVDKWLNLPRLELEVYTDNEPAIRLYKKFGFEIEGTMKMFAFRDGEYVDVYTMARFREIKSQCRVTPKSTG